MKTVTVFSLFISNIQYSINTQRADNINTIILGNTVAQSRHEALLFDIKIHS